ncbi:MAG: DUF5666 domain-containing protein [Gammaproteobacteria bacterium]
MNSLTWKLILLTMLTGIIVACEDDGEIAGIGGSGYTSTGTVTGFGSVFVNGVEFETDSAIFEVEDASGSQDDLRIGMVVQVSGSINTDGITGDATKIRYGDDIEGPITAISENADFNTKTLSILGNTVVIKTADTAFEGVTYGSLLEGYVVEASGFYDDSDVMQASYLKFKSNTYSGSTQFEITGPINGLFDTTFSIRGVTVNAASANLSDLPNGLQNDINVEIKGTYDGVNTITASEVEGEEIELVDDGSEVSIEGYITRYVDVSNFDINGYPVNASNATLEPSTLQPRLGIKVEAEGSVSNGILIASEIESRSGDAEVSAYVDSIDLANERFTVEVVAGQPSVTVQLTTATITEDDVGIDDYLNLSELDVGNFVEVRGFETGTSTINATRVKRVDPDTIKLQGVVTAQTNDISITVLGVEFPVDAISADATEYEDENDLPYADHAALILDTTLGQTVISIEDKAANDGNAVGFADSVEIEIP